MSWYDKAACKGKDPELFFPVGTGRSAQKQTAEAKSVCANCPVRSECRCAADKTASEGVWAATTTDERVADRRAARRRGAA